MLKGYLGDISKEMVRKSEAIRRDFATHRLSGGENREDLLQKFLRDHLPLRFGVHRGLVFSSEGLFSNQADLIVVDSIHNAALYGTSPNQLWPVEGTYALVEVKTSLTLPNIVDAVAKGRRYKSLPRKFAPVLHTPEPARSLVVVWAYECPSLETVKKNIESALKQVPREEQPDLWVVPERVVVQSGKLRETTKLGEAGSPFRAALIEKHGPNLNHLLSGQADVWDHAENSLLAWFVWLNSWFQHIDYRMPDDLDPFSSKIAGRLLP
jgi:hypothetical protein